MGRTEFFCLFAFGTRCVGMIQDWVGWAECSLRKRGLCYPNETFGSFDVELSGWFRWIP